MSELTEPQASDVAWSYAEPVDPSPRPAGSTRSAPVPPTPLAPLAPPPQELRPVRRTASGGPSVLLLGGPAPGPALRLVMRMSQLKCLSCTLDELARTALAAPGRSDEHAPDPEGSEDPEGSRMHAEIVVISGGTLHRARSLTVHVHPEIDGPAQMTCQVPLGPSPCPGCAPDPDGPARRSTAGGW